MFEIFNWNYTYKDFIFDNNGNFNSSDSKYVTEAVMCFEYSKNTQVIF